MPEVLLADEAVLQNLPLPLAQLYRRAFNAKSPLARHLTGFSLWEAGLKLLASVAIVEFARQGDADLALQARLKNLARPALGHWWEFARLLMPRLAERGEEPFVQLREGLLGRSRSDMPRAAGLDALLRWTKTGKEAQRSSVALGELFDRLVQHRNQVQAHGAPGQMEDALHERLGRALIFGSAELWNRVDVLAGRRLVHIAEVRQVGGAWLVDRFELRGESARRLETLSLPHDASAKLPFAGQLYLEKDGVGGGDYPFTSLHPLVLFDAEAEEVLFLNARRGQQRTEYLCYTSGRTADRPDLGSKQCELLTQVLGMPVAVGQAAQWAAQSQAEEPASTGAAAPDDRTLGEFELQSELGRGGMGVVYRAWQPSLGRQVALKKLLTTGDAKAEARFAREIKALGKVEHPSLVKIFTSGAEGDQWFYTMELIEGVPLSAVCDRLQSQKTSVNDVKLATWHDAVTTCCAAARSEEKALGAAPPAAGHGTRPSADAPALESRNYVRHIVTLMAQVAEAAHALHEAGVLHRDIKPGNIMLTQDGSQAVLMDLGLAQLADAVDGHLTRTRQFVGTLRYASPQQVLAVGRLDRRSDVYSLGATLWELLALTPLFGANDQMPTPELMEKIQREEPRRLRALHPGLPRDLEAIVHKCLEKDPNRRYPIAHELARDLNRYLENRPVNARPVHGWERSWKWAKRHPTTAAVYVLVLLAAVLGLGCGVVVWQWQTERKAETERVVSVALVKAEQLADVTAKVPHDRSDQLQAVLGLWERAEGAVAFAERALSTGVAGDTIRLHVQLLRKRVEHGLRETKRHLANTLRKEKLLRELDEARMARLALVDNKGFDYAGAAAKYAAAFAAFDLNVAPGHGDDLARQIAAAEPDVRRALIVALDDWAYTATLGKTAWSASDLRSVARAADDDAWRQRFRAAGAARDKKALLDLNAEARSLALPPSSIFLLADSLQIAGERGAALELLRWGRCQHPTDFWLHFELGTRLRVQSGATPVEIEEAIGCCLAALALRSKEITVFNNLGNAFMAKKEMDKAVAEYRKALAIDPKYVHARYNLGLTFMIMNRFDDGVAEYRKTLELDPRFVSAHLNLGAAMHSKQKVDEAIAEYRKAIELDPRHALAHNNLGVALQEKGQLDEAIAEFLESIKLEPKSARTHANLCAAYLKSGQLAQAKKYKLRWLELLPPKDGARAGALRELALYDRLLPAEPHLSDLLTGKQQPQDNLQRIDLAQLCKYQSHFVGAVKFYEGAFSSDPNLANDLIASHRYNAACYAIRSAAGHDRDAGKLDEMECARLRQLALAWLRADLELWKKKLSDEDAAGRLVLRNKVSHWQGDSDLATVRDASALQQLPTEEAAHWREFWADVAELLAKAQKAR